MKASSLFLIGTAALVAFTVLTVDMPTSGRFCMALVYIITATCMLMVCKPTRQPNHRIEIKHEEDNRH